jgi:hypothetical protein
VIDGQRHRAPVRPVVEPIFAIVLREFNRSAWPDGPRKTLTQNFTDNSFPRITIFHMICFESRNALETAVAQAGDGARIGELASGEEPPSPQDMAKRTLRMLEWPVAGSSLTEVVADEGLTPRRARELMAEAVARRYDP